MPHPDSYRLHSSQTDHPGLKKATKFPNMSTMNRPEFSLDWVGQRSQQLPRTSRRGVGCCGQAERAPADSPNRTRRTSDPQVAEPSRLHRPSQGCATNPTKSDHTVGFVDRGRASTGQASEAAAAMIQVGSTCSNTAMRHSSQVRQSASATTWPSTRTSTRARPTGWSASTCRTCTSTGSRMQQTTNALPTSAQGDSKLPAVTLLTAAPLTRWKQAE